MRPDCFFTMPGTASLQQWKTDDRLEAISVFHWETSISCKSPIQEIPALLTRISRSPKCSWIWANRRTQSSQIPTSAWTARQAAPSVSASFFTCSRRSVLRAQLMTTLYPCSAYFKAMALPIPREEPVTRTVFFIRMSPFTCRQFPGTPRKILPFSPKNYFLKTKIFRKNLFFLKL